MRLLFLINDGMALGGGGYSVIKFSEYLSKLGHDVRVVCNNDFPVNVIKRPRGARHIFNFINKFHDSYLLNKKVDIRGMDFIIGYQTISAIMAGKLGKKYNVKTCIFAFETPEWFEKMLAEKWKKEYSHKNVRMIWRKYKKTLLEADVIFSNSGMSKKENGK